MSRESILQIKETEATAARMVEDAREQARLLLEQATQSGEQLCRNTEREAMEEMERMLSAVRERTEATARRLEAEAQAEAEEMKRIARLHQKIAERIIIRGLDAKCR